MVSKDESFVPRNSVEAVRNGTQVPKSIVSPILQWVVYKLLHTSTPSNTAKDALVPHEEIVNKDWNPGGRVHLGELAQGMPTDLTAGLKGPKVSGGLQTVLRNHNHTFIVEPGGWVRLRNPIVDSVSAGKRRRRGGGGDGSDDASAKRRKTKMCWLFENHPQQCPVSSQACHWAHAFDELVNAENRKT